jgi:hypothetical protein
VAVKLAPFVTVTAAVALLLLLPSCNCTLLTAARQHHHTFLCNSTHSCWVLIFNIVISPGTAVPNSSSSLGSSGGYGCCCCCHALTRRHVVTSSRSDIRPAAVDSLHHAVWSWGILRCCCCS